MIELVPGARTEEGEGEKEENTGRFQMIYSPVCKRPLRDKRETERERTRQTARRERESLGVKEALPKGLLFTKCC